jgi:hypothetical protein
VIAESYGEGGAQGALVPRRRSRNSHGGTAMRIDPKPARWGLPLRARELAGLVVADVTPSHPVANPARRERVYNLFVPLLRIAVMTHLNQGQLRAASSWSWRQSPPVSFRSAAVPCRKAGRRA